MPSKTTETKLNIVLDNIRSAYNVGSIFRTADAAGNCMIYICGISPFPPNPKIPKTSLGAENSVPWKYFKNTQEAIEDLKLKQIPVFAAEKTKNSIDYRQIEFPDTLALVFGHEIEGVGEIPLQMSDKVVHIPMRGIKESLNVATAAGILIFEAVRTAN